MRIVLLLSALLLTHSAGAVEQVTPAAPTASPSAGQLDELDEVSVIGKKLYQMRADILDAEKRFYALYNQLNTNDDFDIRCRLEARTGSRIKFRVCRTRFYERAEAEQAEAFMEGRLAISPEFIAQTRSDEYSSLVTELLQRNPPLMKLAVERVSLQKSYERVRTERFKERWRNW